MQKKSFKFFKPIQLIQLGFKDFRGFHPSDIQRMTDSINQFMRGDTKWNIKRYLPFERCLLSVDQFRECLTLPGESLNPWRGVSVVRFRFLSFQLYRIQPYNRPGRPALEPIRLNSLFTGLIK